MAEAREQLNVAVDEVFNSYDQDGSGTLDKEECFEFLKIILSMISEELEISEDGFEIWFNQIDSDHNRSISKEEMREFLGKLLDIN